MVYPRRISFLEMQDVAQFHNERLYGTTATGAQPRMLRHSEILHIITAFETHDKVSSEGGKELVSVLMLLPQAL